MRENNKEIEGQKSYIIDSEGLYCNIGGPAGRAPIKTEIYSDINIKIRKSLKKPKKNNRFREDIALAKYYR